MNFIEGVVESTGGTFIQVVTAAGALSVKRPAIPLVGKFAMVRFRPEDVELVRSEGTKVESRHYLGDAYLYDATLSSNPIQFRSQKFNPLSVGQAVHIHVSPERCVMFDNGVLQRSRLHSM